MKQAALIVWGVGLICAALYLLQTLGILAVASNSLLAGIGLVCTNVAVGLQFGAFRDVKAKVAG